MSVSYTAGELLGMFQLGIVDKNEVREAFGFTPVDDEEEGK